MDYSESSYFSFLLDAINTPPNFEKSLESAELPNYSFRHTDLNSYFPPSLHLSPASSNSTLSNSSNFSNEFFTCLPSPTNSVIETKNLSPLLQAHSVKSHKLEGYHHFQEVANQQTQQQSILTTIDSKSKGKKYISKKQKKINELPYAPNLLNLQLTPPPKTSISNPDENCNSKKAPKNHSPSLSSSTYVISTNLPLSPSSASSNKTSSAYRCDFPNCDKVFTRPYNLKSHRRTHTAERPFDCPLCPKSFARQHDRNRHAKLHLGIKPYTCQFCTKSFARQDALNRHQRIDDASSPTCARSIRARRSKNPPPPPPPSISFDLSSSSVLSPSFVSSSPLSSNAMLFSSCTL